MRFTVNIFHVKFFGGFISGILYVISTLESISKAYTLSLTLSNLEKFLLVCNSTHLLMGARNTVLRRGLRMLPGSQKITRLFSVVCIGRRRCQW